MNWVNAGSETLVQQEQIPAGNRSLLVVDDEPAIISSLRRLLRREGYEIYTAGRGEDALELLVSADIGVVLSDQMMPGMKGIDLLERVKAECPDVVRLLMTANDELATAVNAVNRSQIFGYLPKPWSPDQVRETLIRAFETHNLIRENRRLHALTLEQNNALKTFNEGLEARVRERTEQLEEAIHEGVMMLALAAEAKDDDTGDHLQRIQQTTRELCRALGVPRKTAEEFAFFSIMHDVGKIHIPDAILQKPGPLTPEEWVVMKTHTAAGWRILGKKPFYQTARDIARHHHERWDGKGYPDGLRGRSIPLSARIVTVADVFDALTHERPYKPAWPREKALEEMAGLTEKAFDPVVLAEFMALQERKGPEEVLS